VLSEPVGREVGVLAAILSRHVEKGRYLDATGRLLLEGEQPLFTPQGERRTQEALGAH